VKRKPMAPQTGQHRSAFDSADTLSVNDTREFIMAVDICMGSKATLWEMRASVLSRK
jgi:ribosomal protein L3